MANWNLPSIGDLYADIISLFKSRDADLAKGLDPARVTVENPEAYFIRWNSASKKWEVFNGTTWESLAATFAINVDKVDGCDAGTAANNVLKLDGSAKVPAGNLPATANALEMLSTFGVLVKSAAGTMVARVVSVSGAGLSASNGNGVSGNPTLSLANDVAAIEAQRDFWLASVDLTTAVTGGGVAGGGGTTTAVAAGGEPAGH